MFEVVRFDTLLESYDRYAGQLTLDYDRDQF